jgi:DNA-binding GntR family transcriptional regulator
VNNERRSLWSVNDAPNDPSIFGREMDDYELHDPKTPLVRLNLSQQIVDRLRDEIVHGDIPAGTHLVQAALCKRFGTSRMPVRDALRQLAQEGLLRERGGQREVASLGEDDLLDVHTIIGVLFGWAARQVAESATVEELNELKTLFEQADDADEPLEFSQIAWRWHKRINVLAGSPRLVQAIVALQRTVPRVFPFSLRDDLEVTKQLYRSVLEAILRRDAATSERLGRDLAIDMARSVSEMVHSDLAESIGE